MILPALGAGFLGSGHCAVMCGPLLGAAGATRADRVAWQFGRLLAYLGLGALAGALGAVQVVAWPVGPVVTLAALCWFAADLAGLPLPGRRWLGARGGQLAGMTARLLGRAGLGRYGARIGLGLATALLPCGLLWSGLGLAASAGSALLGMGVLLAFFLGTVPALGLAGLLPQLLPALLPANGFGRAGRQLVAVLVLALGTWAVSARAGWLDDHPSEAQLGAHACPLPGGPRVP